MQRLDRATPFEIGVLASIAIGGSIGACGRWFVAWVLERWGVAHAPGTWPWSTLIVNVVGCMAIGFAARSLRRDTVAWAFVVTGALGGFTTFSALAVELNDFAEAERLPMALTYGAVTLGGGLGATLVAHRPVEVGE